MKLRLFANEPRTGTGTITVGKEFDSIGEHDHLVLYDGNMRIAYFHISKLEEDYIIDGFCDFPPKKVSIRRLR